MPDMTISEVPWSNYSAADYNVQQWCAACLIHQHDGPATSKDQCKLPVKTPDGALNRSAVHAAAAALAGARGGVNASADEKTKAAKALVRLYGMLGEQPAASLKQSDVDAFIAHVYDPVKAHQYYETHKKLKGRKKGPANNDPRTSPTNKHRTAAIAKNAKQGLSQEKRKQINQEALKAKAQLTKLTEQFRSWVDAHPKASPAEKEKQRVKMLDQKNEVVKKFHEAVTKISGKAATEVKHDDVSFVDNFLAHFGIKGMKWGFRRERGPGGTVSSGLIGSKQSADAERAAATLHAIRKAKTVSAASDADLQHLVKRLDLERKFKEIDATALGKTNRGIKRLLKYGGTANDLISFAHSPAGQLLHQAVTGKSKGRHAAGRKGP